MRVVSYWRIERIAFKLRYLVLACGIAAISAPAAPQSIPGFYVRGGAGLNIDNTFDGEQGRLQALTHPGPSGALAFGYSFGNGLRAEIEGDIKSNDVSAINTPRVNHRFMPLTNTVGSVDNHGVMVNGLYDLPLASLHLPFRPYVGAGIGYNILDLGSAAGSEPFLYPGSGNPGIPGGGLLQTAIPSRLTYGSVGVFAYQAIVGAAFPIGSIPGLEATLEYRYFGTTHGDAGQTVRPLQTLSPAFGGTPAPVHSGANFATSANSVMVGFRYALMQPKP